MESQSPVPSIAEDHCSLLAAMMAGVGALGRAELTSPVVIWDFDTHGIARSLISHVQTVTSVR